jgi:CubicO group peptidase (beta-lactamase class C family)
VVVVAALAMLGLASAGSAADSASTQPAAARTDYGPVKAELSRYIRSLMAENRTAGLAIALVDGPRVVWTKGFGFADVAARKLVSADTVLEKAAMAEQIQKPPVAKLAIMHAAVRLATDRTGHPGDGADAP